MEIMAYLLAAHELPTTKSGQELGTCGVCAAGHLWSEPLLVPWLPSWPWHHRPGAAPSCTPVQSACWGEGLISSTLNVHRPAASLDVPGSTYSPTACRCPHSSARDLVPERMRQIPGDDWIRSGHLCRSTSSPRGLKKAPFLREDPFGNVGKKASF